MKDQMSSLPSQSGEQGFSLIEVVIVVLLIGILLVPFITRYNIDMKSSQINTTTTNLADVAAALEKYALKYGRYPRPANPSMAANARVTVNTINYGSGDEQPNEFSTPVAPAYPTCPTAPSAAQTSVCQTAGTRDTIFDANTTPDPIYIGSVPYADLGLNQSQSVDGFGNKLRYVVSAYQTRRPPPAFDRSIGVITTQDNLGTPTSADSTQLHYIILSHGTPGRGAYTLAGTQVVPCGPVTTARDNANCDYNGIFDDGRVAYTYVDPFDGSTRTDRVQTKQSGNTPAAWDNYMVASSGSGIEGWVEIANSLDTGTMDVDAIRINTDIQDSTVRTEVGGDVRTNRIYTENICDPEINANSCIAPFDIGRDTAPAVRSNPDTDASGIRCAAFSAMTGISGGNEECGTLRSTNLGTFVLTPCPSGQYPNGINAAGQRTCSLP